jgi:hypothetical protein
MKIDTVTMFTSEIAVVEINTLREKGMTLVIPSEFEVDLVTHVEDMTYVHITRKQPEGENA